MFVDKKTYISVAQIKAGDYLEFYYHGKLRSAVVIAADYKGNVDAYEVTPLDREPLVLQVMGWDGELKDGELWNVFKSNGPWPYKSFKRSNISIPKKVTFTATETDWKTNQSKIEGEARANYIRAQGKNNLETSIHPASGLPDSGVIGE